MDEQYLSPNQMSEGYEPEPVQNFAIGGIALPGQRAFLRGSDKNYLAQRAKELEAYEAQRQAYNSALTKYQDEVYKPYSSQYDAYSKAVETWNAGPRTEDYAGPAEPTLASSFEMKAPELPFKEADVKAYQQAAGQRAQKDAASRAVAIDVASNPDKFNFGSMSVAGRFMAEGGPVESDDNDDMFEGMVQELGDNTRMSREQIMEAVDRVAAAGRGGDELLAYLSPESVELLKQMGGSGTTNPDTGLPEFFLRGLRRALNRIFGRSSAAPAPAPAPAAAPIPIAERVSAPVMGTPAPAPAPTPVAAPAPATAKDQLAAITAPQPKTPQLSDAIAQLKGNDKQGAEDTMRAIVGLPPLQRAAPAPMPEKPQLSDAIARLKGNDKQGAEDIMRAIVGLPPINRTGAKPPGPGLVAPGPSPIAPPPSSVVKPNFGFTRDPDAIGTSALVKWRNTKTGETYTAPDGATRPPSSDWVRDEGDVIPQPSKPPAVTPTLPDIPIGRTPTPMPIFGQPPAPPKGPAVDPKNYFGIAPPSPNQGISPGTRAIGSPDMPLEPGKITMGAIGANKNLSPTMLGGQENAGFITDRLGNRIYAPASPLLFAEGGEVAGPDSAKGLFSAFQKRMENFAQPAAPEPAPAKPGALSKLFGDRIPVLPEPEPEPPATSSEGFAVFKKTRDARKAQQEAAAKSKFYYSPEYSRQLQDKMPQADWYSSYEPQRYADGGEVAGAPVFSKKNDPFGIKARKQKQAEQQAEQQAQQGRGPLYYSEAYSKQLQDKMPQANWWNDYGPRRYAEGGEVEEDYINTDPLGSAQKMMADLMGSKKASPNEVSVKRVAKSSGGAKSGKEMTMGIESLMSAKSQVPELKGEDSARSQMEALALAYKLKAQEASNAARGLMRNTMGAPTLEKPALTKNSLAKKRFAKGGEAKKSEEAPAQPEVTGVSKLVDFIAQRLPAGSFPTAGKVFLESVQGNKGPITESSFSKDELEVLKKLAKGQKGVVRYEDYQALVEDIRKQGKSADATSSFFSLGSPVGNVRNTLGGFTYSVDPSGNMRVTDTYDFNPRDKSATQEARTGDYGAFGPFGLMREYAGEKIPPGHGRQVDINLGPAVKRAEGSPKEGEVSQAELDAASRPAFVTPKSGIGRKQGPISRALNSGEAYVNMAKGATELPYDIAGAPVDIATMALRPFGYGVDKPVMSSDWIKEKMTAAKVRPEPPKDATDKGFYTAGQLLSNLANPAGVTRSGVRAVQKAGEAASDVAKDFQQYNRQLAVPSASYVSRAPGGYFPTSRANEGGILSSLDKALDPVLKDIKAVEDPAKREALSMMFNQKAKDFFTKQAGSIQDPLRADILSGAMKFDDMSLMGDVFPRTLQKSVAQGDLQALRLLEKKYDEMLGIRSVVPRRTGTLEVANVPESQIMSNMQANLDKIPDAQLLAYAGKKPGPGPTGVADAAAQVRNKLQANPTLFATVLEPRIARTLFPETQYATDTDMARYPGLYGTTAVEAMVVNPALQPKTYSEKVAPGYFLPDMDKAIEKGQPILDINNDRIRLLGMDSKKMLSEALQMPAEELNQMGFADFLKKAYASTQQTNLFEAALPKVKRMIEDGKVPPADVMTHGIKDFLPTAGDFRWVKVAKPDGVRAIAAGMNNSVGSYANSTTYGSLNKGRAALDNGEAEIYSLYDKNNVPHVTVEYLTAKSAVPDDKKNTIAQLTGNGPLTANASPENYAPQIVDLLNNLRPSSVPSGIKRLLEKTGQKAALSEEVMAPLYFGLPIEAMRPPN